ncbi:MAG: metallophosphoesterase [Planctomycetota bacterium]|jgi:predicted MPP superfamily phosphohydrolase
MTADATAILFLLIVTPLLAAAACLLWFLARVRRRWQPEPEGRPPLIRRWWVVLPSAVYLAIYLACLLWAWLIEPYRVDVTNTVVTVPEPVLGHDRFRIVHLSDLHLEGKTSRERKMIEAVHAAKPHLILLTGDYLNERESTPILADILESFDAPYGVYAVTGNWDRKFIIADIFSAEAKRRGPDAKGPRLLQDDYVLVRSGGMKLLILGQAYRSQRTLTELLEGASEDAYRIFLHHTPDASEQIVALPPDRHVDLFLCGHTHGGQVRLPFWGAVITFAKQHKKYETGLYKVGETDMYVNRGLGLEGGPAPRIRFLCRPEVAIIDLVVQP